MLLTFNPAEGPADALLSASDVQVLARYFVTSASISLDPLSRKLSPEPLQEVTMQPACLAGSPIATTMLQADMLLKQLTTGYEVSAKAPFA